MNKKESFLKAVQILAPDDQFILQSAHCVAEESLPDTPGGAALEFVVAMQRLTRHGHAKPGSNRPVVDPRHTPLALLRRSPSR